MQERTLVITAICCVIIGIPLLLVLGCFVEPGELRMMEKMIVGEVMNVRSGKVTTLYVEETRLIPVVSFDNVDVEKGSVVEAEGRMQKGEFIADSIRIHHPS